MGSASDRAAKKAREDAARIAALGRNPYVKALMAIAEGDNDPRATAQAALGDLWEILREKNDGDLDQSY